MKVCIDCPKEISRRSKTGRCRSCCARHVSSDPANGRKISVAMRAHFRCPESGAERRARVKRNLERWRETPEAKDVLRRLVRVVQPRSQTPEARAKHAAAVRATRNAWCPPHLRETNETLRRNRFSLAERKQMIAEIEQREVEAVRAKFRAAGFEVGA